MPKGARHDHNEKKRRIKEKTEENKSFDNIMNSHSISNGDSN